MFRNYKDHYTPYQKDCRIGRNGGMREGVGREGWCVWSDVSMVQYFGCMCVDAKIQTHALCIPGILPTILVTYSPPPLSKVNKNKVEDHTILMGSLPLYGKKNPTKIHIDKCSVCQHKYLPSEYDSIFVACLHYHFFFGCGIYYCKTLKKDAGLCFCLFFFFFFLLSGEIVV